MEWKIVHIAETDSTNRWLKDYDLTGGQPPCEVVVADFQTAGRGCGTNTWESERGKNLLFSMLVHPTELPLDAVASPKRLPLDAVASPKRLPLDAVASPKRLPANRQFRISMAISVAIVNALSSYLSPLTSHLSSLISHLSPLSIKWPNDIYVGDRKICGILIENQLQGSSIKDSIIGVGLNVNQLRFVSDAPNPVSLANLTGRQFDREQLLQQLLEAFDAEWADLEGVRSRYLPLLYRRMGFHRYRDAQSEFCAELVTVEDDGHLVLRNIDGYDHRYAFKEVQFVI